MCRCIHMCISIQLYVYIHVYVENPVHMWTHPLPHHVVGPGRGSCGTEPWGRTPCARRAAMASRRLGPAGHTDDCSRGRGGLQAGFRLQWAQMGFESNTSKQGRSASGKESFYQLGRDISLARIIHEERAHPFGDCRWRQICPHCVHTWPRHAPHQPAHSGSTYYMLMSATGRNSMSCGPRSRRATLTLRQSPGRNGRRSQPPPPPDPKQQKSAVDIPGVAARLRASRLRNRNPSTPKRKPSNWLWHRRSDSVPTCFSCGVGGEDACGNRT